MAQHQFQTFNFNLNIKVGPFSRIILQYTPLRQWHSYAGVHVSLCACPGLRYKYKLGLGERRDFLPSKWANLVPIPSAFGLPFYLGPNYAVTMGLGSVIKYFWERSDSAGADLFVIPGPSPLFQVHGNIKKPHHI